MFFILFWLQKSTFAARTYIFYTVLAAKKHICSQNLYFSYCFGSKYLSHYEGRKIEIQKLERVTQSKKSEFLTVYGRRRFNAQLRQSLYEFSIYYRFDLTNLFFVRYLKNNAGNKFPDYIINQPSSPIH
jgi:hypothetical protein